ncbi:integrase core domain-containing protein [Planktomarina temperata]|nr:integrase core domain-containing protein [Planktomarina temperata]
MIFRKPELLNTEWFHSVKQAQVAINIWLKEYNHIRPHHALGMRPPVPETLLEKREIYGTEIGRQTVRDFKNKGFLGRKKSLRSIFARFEGVLARSLNMYMILFANLQRY